MPISTETIGSFIKRLFPNGFCNHTYTYLLFEKGNGVNLQRKTLFLSEILKNGPKTYTKIKKYIEDNIDTDKTEKFSDFVKFNKESGYIENHNKYKGIITDATNIKKISEEYIVPPISPFDMFIIMSKLLNDSGAYHHFESEFEGEAFLDVKDERKINKVKLISCDEIQQWKQLGDEWFSINLYELNDSPFNKNLSPNKSITSFWVKILNSWHKPVYKNVSSNEEQPDWWYAAYSLMVIADEASKGTGFKRLSNEECRSDASNCSPWIQLTEMIIDAVNREKKDDNKYLKDREKYNTEPFSYVESLSLADRSIANVLPKSRTSPLGSTLRRISHNLALLPGSGTIRVGWDWAEPPHDWVNKNPVFNMLLIPYPYKILSKNFKPVGVSKSNQDNCNNNELRWGKFTLDVRPNDDEDEKFVSFVSRLITESDKKLGKNMTHAVVLPELALSRKSIIALRNKILEKHSSIELLCSGVREDLYLRFDDEGNEKESPVNASYMASLNYSEEKSETINAHEIFHEKHHKWRVTEQQVSDYDLSPALDPSRVWWEDLNVVNRRLPFLVMRNQWTLTSLICEDLARNDPARTVVEAIGPNLVISLLMDGPQIPERWSARYATVLAEDPGSSVLSMSSLGLIERSNKVFEKVGHETKKSFALWRDDRGISIPIELEEGYHATTISLNLFPINDYTLDGRADNRSLALRLTAQRSIKDSERDFDPKGENPDFYPPWGSSKEND